jgi:histidyl-tRNA synthetase
MFRYERPQKGRMRPVPPDRHRALGIKEPLGDVEVIATGAEFLRRIGAWDRSQLEINTLGDNESRQNYRKVLVEYSLRPQGASCPRTASAAGAQSAAHPGFQGTMAIRRSSPMRRSIPTTSMRGSRDFFAKVKGGSDAMGIMYVVNRGWCAASTITATPVRGDLRGSGRAEDHSGRRPLRRSQSA